MTRATITPTRLDRVPLAASLATMRAQAARTMIGALRRCTGDALDRGAWAGRAVDPRALARAAIAPAMLRTAQTTGAPDIGLAIIVDRSGSMAAKDGHTYSRLNRAHAVALGVADAARALAMPCALLHHAEGVNAHRTASGFAAASTGGGNRDAIAVRSAHAAYARFAGRILTVLICDGSPCVEEQTHRATAAQVRAMMQRRGDALLGLLIVRDETAARRMANDWGARACALATDSAAVTRATVRAVASMTARA